MRKDLYIDEIEKRIAADDNDKIDAIEEAATFITGNWGSIRLKIDDEIDKAFPIDCEQDCHFIRFEQVYYCSTYVFLDVHELFEGEEFAFYVFVFIVRK